jgi:hypothetical protein
MYNSRAPRSSAAEEVCEHDTHLPQAGQALTPVREMLSATIIDYFILNCKKLWIYVRNKMNI